MSQSRFCGVRTSGGNGGRGFSNHGVAFIVLTLSVIATGCGEKGGARPAPAKTFPVKGTVTYQGKPLPEALVLFRSKDGKWTASGRTDTDGKYKLTTFNPGDGAPAGEYLVSVTAFESPSAAEDEEKPAPPPKLLIPAKYRLPETSGLTAVVEQKENEINFDLK